MAKRFCDTDKYKKPFIRGLKGAYKLLWDYILHDCDHAGIWIVDFEIAQLYLGKDMEVNQADALKFFNNKKERIVVMSDSKWFIAPFIEFQYGELSEDNRVHRSVIALLKKNSVNYTTKNNKPLNSPLKRVKDKDKDKDKVKEKDKEALLEFDKVRVAYPGTTRKNVTEFANFKKKYKNWKEIIPLLIPAIQRQKQWRAEAGTDFRPPWKMFTTWINKSSWEDSVDIAEATEDNKACITCHAAYVEGKHKYTMNNVTNQKEYRCAECRGAK